jgi:hypothetical protein
MIKLPRGQATVVQYARHVELRSDRSDHALEVRKGTGDGSRDEASLAAVRKEANDGSDGLDYGNFNTISFGCYRARE